MLKNRQKWNLLTSFFLLTFPSIFWLTRFLSLFPSTLFNTNFEVLKHLFKNQFLLSYKCLNRVLSSVLMLHPVCFLVAVYSLTLHLPDIFVQAQSNPDFSVEKRWIDEAVRSYSPDFVLHRKWLPVIGPVASESVFFFFFFLFWKPRSSEFCKGKMGKEKEAYGLTG